MTEVTKDLQDTKSKLLEVVAKLSHAKAMLSRIEYPLPYSGEVVGLNVFSSGSWGQLLDVVPERDSLIGEAQIAVDDIVNVHPDMNADVPLIAYKAHITPVVRGKSDSSFGRSIDRKTHRQSLLCCARAHR